MTVYGFARVSTSLAKNQQNLALQTDALKAAGCEVIITERVSGASKSRPEREKLLAKVKEGDSIVVWKLDRWGRSMADLTATLDDLTARGIKFVSLTEAIDTHTAQGRLLAGILSSIAAFERDLVRERVKAGLAASKKKKGRPRALTPANARLARRMYDEEESVSEIARQFGVSRQTVYNALNDPDTFLV